MDWMTQRYIYWAIGIGVGLLIAGIIAFCKLYHRQTGLEDVYGPSRGPAGGRARTSSRVTHVHHPDNTQPPAYDRHQYDSYGGRRYDITGIPNRDFDVTGRRATRSGRNVVFESAYADMVQEETCDDRLGIVENEVLPNTDQTAQSRRPDDRRECPAQTSVIQTDGEAPPPPYHVVVGGKSQII